MKVDEAKETLDNLSAFDEKEDLQIELDRIQKDLNEQVEARYVTYEIVEDATDKDKLTFKVSEDFFKAGNVNYLTNNKRLAFQNKGNSTVEAFYVKYDWNTPEAGDKWETSLRFNGGVRTLAVEITNNGDGTWSIDSDWLINKGE